MQNYLYPTVIANLIVVANLFHHSYHLKLMRYIIEEHIEMRYMWYIIKDPHYA